jgi:hypothetical protein
MAVRNRPDGPERRWELPRTEYRVNHFIDHVKRFWEEHRLIAANWRNGFLTGGQLPYNV